MAQRQTGININKLALKTTGKGGAKSRTGAPPPKSRAQSPAKIRKDALAKIRAEDEPAKGKTKTTSAASKKLKAGAAAQPVKKFVPRKLTPAERAAKIAQKKAIRAVVREKPAKAERKPRSEKNIRAVTVKETQLNAIEPAKRKTSSGLDTFQRAAVAARLADDRKAVDILLLDVRGLCNFADIFVICSATNRVQLNAIAENVAMGLKKMGEKTPLQDGHRNANWSVLDFGDVVIHVMSAEARSFYRLEKLWGDAKELDWDEIISKMPKATAS